MLRAWERTILYQARVAPVFYLLGRLRQFPHLIGGVLCLHSIPGQGDYIV